MIIIHVAFEIITISFECLIHANPLLDVILELALVFLIILKSCHYHACFQDEVIEAWGG